MDQIIEKLSGIMFLGNSLYHYILTLLSLAGLLILAKLVHYLIGSTFGKFAERTKNKLDDLIWETLDKPLLYTFYLGALYFSLKFLEFSNGSASIIRKIWITLITIVIGTFIYRLWNQICEKYIIPLTEKTENTLDDQVVPLIHKTGKVIIITVIAITVLSNLGYDVFSLIAGLGIGGIALALAAQDTLSNLFSGVAIFLDKPFKLYDVVSVNGEMGTVEEIGLRTTRIRTFDDQLIVIPNADVTKKQLINVSKRRRRKVIAEIGLTYDTSADDLRKAKSFLMEILGSNEKVDGDAAVYFDSFGAYSLNLKTIFWIKELNYAEFMTVKDDINFKIKENFDNAGLSFAFPTYSVDIPTGSSIKIEKE